jgi:predicted MFS family arabinose efflux permease
MKSEASKAIRKSKEKIHKFAKKKMDKVGGKEGVKVIILLAGIFSLYSSDLATVSATASYLKNYFHINNTQIGILVAIVAFSGSFFTLPFGVLVDWVNRKNILLITISLWSVASIVSGTATSFTFLVATRFFLGVVIASASPAIASLTGDFFPAVERARIYGYILSGELIGAGMGFLISSEIASVLGWRWPFYIMGILSAMYVFLLWRYFPEPLRGGKSWIFNLQEESSSKESATSSQGNRKADKQERKTSEELKKIRESIEASGIKPRKKLILNNDPAKESLWWAIKYVVKIPTFLLLVIASSLVFFFYSGVRAFIMVYLPKHYHVSSSTISELAIVIGIGAILGIILGGYLSKWLFNWGWYNARVIIPGVSIFISIFFFGYGLWTSGVILGVLCLTIAFFFTGAANPSIDAARLDIIHPRLWGRAESIRMALRSFGEGSAPIIFGLIADSLGGLETGLKWTYLIMLIPLALACLLVIPAYYTYPVDVLTAAAYTQKTKMTAPSPKGKR